MAEKQCSGNRDLKESGFAILILIMGMVVLAFNGGFNGDLRFWDKIFGYIYLALAFIYTAILILTIQTHL